MSSGGCLAALLALRFPKLFAGVAIHSGVAGGAASAPAAALNVLAKGADSDIDTIAFEARAEASPRALPLPICLIHGEHDPVVAQKNSTELLRQFLIFNGRFAPSSDGLPDPDSSKVTRLSNGRTMTTDDYRVNGRVVARPVLRLCGTFDHRIIDGASAGALARAIREGLERFDSDAPAVSPSHCVPVSPPFLSASPRSPTACCRTCFRHRTGVRSRPTSDGQSRSTLPRRNASTRSARPR